MEFLTLLASGGLLVVGALLGRAVRFRPKPDSGLVCSCKHGYGQHEQGERCVAEVKREHFLNLGDRNGWEYVPCPCLSYDGPEPLPKVWTPGGGL